MGPNKKNFKKKWGQIFKKIKKILKPGPNKN